MSEEARTFSEGFTLIELLIALAVMVILAAVAIPAYSNMLISQRLTAQSNTFLSVLHFARSEAIKRNSRVVVCKSASGEACTDSGGWQQGWMVFDDANNNANLDAGEDMLRRGQALDEGYFMTGNGPVEAYVSYTPFGLTKKTSGAFQAGTITLCQPAASGGEARQIVISITGRPRIEKAIAAACP
jgi:type IV fimbrial biogenesis protein FimT